ncbi:NAD(P)-binding protein [Gonapodya prolifera JEL478]|uniref:NAD(P)-binding protein n=1 Tax=Gonapodya prolifera (strain JEL478) TaxID=1344416 RepID=A0A139AW64_GONPJ|nr:NAD(P)-binding protein [Gonapodya prolifera JEL478]|eukprot:KXS20944.1 NAD(P)-binding protein [Gonapodya prolifera JEL478]
MPSDPTTPWTILVLGGTGLVGGHCLRHLKARLSAPGSPSHTVTVRGRPVRIIATARSQDKARLLAQQGLAHEYRVLDLDQPRTFKKVLDGCNAVFFVNGYTAAMMHQAKWFIDAAAAAGVEHFVHLSADIPKNQFIQHIAWHELIDAYLETKLPNKWTLLAPGFFTENIVTYNGRKRVENGVITALGNPNAPIQFIACEDIGEVAACCLLDPDAHLGKTHTLLTEVTTIAEAVRTISRVLHTPLTLVPRTAQQTYDEALQLDPQDGGRLAYFACIRDLMGVTMAGLEAREKARPQGAPAKRPPVYPEVIREICGREPITIERWAKRNAEWFGDAKGGKL